MCHKEFYFMFIREASNIIHIAIDKNQGWITLFLYLIVHRATSVRNAVAQYHHKHSYILYMTS